MGREPDKKNKTSAERRQERLAAELRSNLLKRKAQARSRTAGAQAAEGKSRDGGEGRS